MSNSYFPVSEATPLLFDNNDWETLLPSISETSVDDDPTQTIDFRHSFRTADNNDAPVPIPVLAFELLAVLYHLTTLSGSTENIKRERLAEMGIKLFHQIVETIKANDDSGKRTEYEAFLIYKFKLDPSARKYLRSKCLKASFSQGTDTHYI